MRGILVIAGTWHMGDDPGVFQDAQYIGHRWQMPLTVTWIDPATTMVRFIFRGHDVETWGVWKGHRVALNGEEIGRIKDAGDADIDDEEFVIQVARSDFERILAGQTTCLLEIELDVQAQTERGLEDDWVLTRCEVDGFAAKIGW